MPSPWEQSDEADQKEDPGAPDHGGHRGCLGAGLGLLTIVGALVIYLIMRDGSGNEPDWGRIVYLVVLLAFISAGVGRGFSRNPGKTMRQAAIWIAITAGVALLYSFQDEFSEITFRLMGQFDPASPQTENGGVVFYTSEGGQFFVRAEVEGKLILFLVDTGASDIVISPRDARTLGYDPGQLRYDRIYQTANGVGRGASITIESLAIGPIDERMLPASVNEADMDVSLLGMTFLNRLSGYEVRGDKLVLYP